MSRKGVEIGLDPRLRASPSMSHPANRRT